MKHLLIIIFSLCAPILLFADPNNQKSTGSIEGTVIDRSTYQPLAGVNIIISGLPLGAASDLDGKFLVEKVPIGTYRVEALMIGYQTEVKTEIVVSTNRVIMVNFSLKTSPLELGDEIVVTADYFQKDIETPISAKRLTPQEIRSSAGSAEDIFRIIQSMPGVSGAGGKSANLAVRGGSPDENRTLLDNVEIYNPLHFARLGTSMGIISIVNPSLLQSVDFLTGGFPAKYGDKMSSVFEMQLKEGNRTNFNTDINANLGGFGVLLDGPIPGNGTMVFSVRRGFFDVLTSMMGKPVAPRFWDLVAKATYNPAANHKLSLIGFYYLDDIEKTGTMADAGSDIGRKYDYAKRDDYGAAVGINWRYLFSKKGYMQTTAAFTANGWKSWVGTENNKDLNGEDVKENEFHFKNEITYKFSNIFELKGGLFYKTIDSDHYKWKCADTTRTGFIFQANTVYYYPDLTYKAGSFLQTTLRPFKRLAINAGLRYDYFDFTKESKVSPRLGLTYRLTDKTTLNAAYGHFYQTPAAYMVALDEANLNLLSSRSIHYIAGVEHLLSPDTKVSVEVYHKELDDVFVDSDTSKILTNAGSGYARGIEFYIQKKMSRNLVGSVAYTYSISKRKDADYMPEYNFEFDRPHNFTLVGGYKLSDKWQIGLKFQYASGSPYTPVVDAVQKGGEWYAVEGEKNSERYPDFHKLDIRIDRRFNFSKWTLSVYLDLWNAYYRDNVIYYIYDLDNNGVVTKEATYDFPLFTIFGISAQF
jgi:outer membrane receptor protein involved in Fe transport